MQNTQLKARSDSQEKPYRWPQKVQRYGLMPYPFLRLFVALYENEVPWNTRPQGWCAESLRAYIRAEMLPSLKPVAPQESAGTSFGDRYYLRRINLDAALNEAGNEYLKLLKKERSHNPRSAAQKAIEYFNRGKHGAFEDWWQVMNAHYADQPEWIYCLLKRMFATSGRDSRAHAPRVRLETVKKLAHAVSIGDISPSVGLSEAYLLIDAGMYDSQSVYLANGWTRVAIDNPRLSYSQKIDLLSYLGRKARWCIADPRVADNYLSGSDFYVLCTAGSPVVAIRCARELSKDSTFRYVQEVTGVANRRVRQNPAVDLMIAVLRRTTVLQEQDTLHTGSRLSCLDLDGWKRVLETVPFALHYAPEKVRSLDAIQETVCAAQLHYVHRDPFWFSFAFREKRNFRNLSPHFEATLAFTLREASIPAQLLGKTLLRNPRLRTAWEHGWIRHLKEKASTLGVPYRVLALPEIRPLAVDAFRIDLESDQLPTRFYTFYGEHPGLLEEWRQAWIRRLNQTKDPGVKVPSRLGNDEEIVSAWAEAHMDSAKGGKAPIKAPLNGMLREAWCRLWIVALKARKQAGSYIHHRDIPQELIHQTVIQSALVMAWLSFLQKLVKERSPKVGETFDCFLHQIREGLRYPQALRDFVLGYLRITARFGEFPSFETLLAQKESDPVKQTVLNGIATDCNFQRLWRNAWQQASIARLRALSKGLNWRSFFIPEAVAQHPAVRFAAGEAYIAFLQNKAESKSSVGTQGILDPASAQLIANPKTEAPSTTVRYADPICHTLSETDGSACPPVRENPVHALAVKTASAFFEHLALHGTAPEIETPQAAVAENPEWCRQWSEQWPQLVADRIPVEHLSHAIGCTEIGIPATVWERPAGRLVLRQLVLRFLSNRGPGRPLATNDALPKAVANDPEMQEAWVATWERVLHAMPQEYAVYRRVAMNVQHSPRVFWAWLQAVRPLNRPREEEEAWRTFLLVHSGGGFPPVLPRLEIFERNPKLRSMLRDALRNDSARSGTPSSKEANDFITRGMRSLFRKSKSQTACHAAQPLADVELLQKAFPLASADAQEEGRTRRVDAADYALLREASEVLRASPWLLEWLPPEAAWTPCFREAVLSGWKAYLGVSPWLLPSIPAAWRRHFHKTRSGIQMIEQPPAQRPREPLHEAA